MKFNITFLVGVAVIALCTGAACSAVGTNLRQNNPGEKYGAELPVTMLLITALPFALGYSAGRQDRE